MAYISLIRRNLISIPIFDRLGYNFPFGTGKIDLYRDSLLIGNGTLCGNLYRLGLYSFLSFCPNVNTVSSTKRLKLNEKSSILLHKHWVIFHDIEYLFSGWYWYKLRAKRNCVQRTPNFYSWAY